MVDSAIAAEGRGRVCRKLEMAGISLCAVGVRGTGIGSSSNESLEINGG